MSKHYPPAYMTKKNIAEICHYCEELDRMISEDDHIPQWVTHKISQIRTYMGDVKHFIKYENEMRHAHRRPAARRARAVDMPSASGRPGEPAKMAMERHRYSAVDHLPPRMDHRYAAANHLPPQMDHHGGFTKKNPLRFTLNGAKAARRHRR